MALPINSVEQLSRRPSDARSPGWFGQLLMFSTTMFLLSIGIYGGMKFGYQTYLKAQNEEKKKEIAAFAVQIPVDQQDKLIAFYSQLQNLNGVLDKHITTAQVFPWLESATLSSVFFSHMTVNTASGQIALSGAARSLADFSQQLKIFQDKTSDVSRVTFSNVNVNSKGLWQFDVTLFMKPAFFGVQTLGGQTSTGTIQPSAPSANTQSTSTAPAQTNQSSQSAPTPTR